MKALLIGYGEIGRGVHENFKEFHDIYPFDPLTAPAQPDPSREFDILLVAIPWSDIFELSVRAWADEFDIEHILVFSTTPIGTCTKLGACHCPVEGRHPDLAESIRITDKWLGGYDKTCWDFLLAAGFKVNQLRRPEHTEFLKLRSTTLYGVNIEFARYSKAVCDDLDLDFEMVKQWDKWVDRLYDSMQLFQFRRYYLDPPVGPIGGHCVVPNAKLLNEQYPSPLVNEVAGC